MREEAEIITRKICRKAASRWIARDGLNHHWLPLLIEYVTGACRPWNKHLNWFYSAKMGGGLLLQLSLESNRKALP